MLLMGCLITTLAAIAILFHISHTTGLHQSAFIFREKLKLYKAVATFTPYSVIPTTLALGIKLWFAALGDASKRLQPYVSMLKQPTPLMKSVLTEYANTPTALISAKAISNAHWLLALIGVGAFATEVCKTVQCSYAEDARF